MPANPDFRDLFAIFNEENVEYLVVGAHAVIYFSEPRYTKDLDVWINPTVDNATRAHKALERFGAPVRNLTVRDLCDEDMVYQIGVAPNRIDILMGVSGLDFDSAWETRVCSSYGGVPISILGKENLIKTKEAAGRPQDLLDIERLRADAGWDGPEPA